MTTLQPKRQQAQDRRSMGHAIMWVLILCFIAVNLFPFLWVLITSFKPGSEIYGAQTAFRIIAAEPTAGNYVTVVQKGILSAVLNSLLVSGITTGYVVLVASMSAYVIARCHFRGKTALMALILGISMFPQMIVVGPIFNMFFQLRMLNSYWVTMAYSTITLPSAVWIMVAHFKRIPLSVEEAAKIDGCTEFKAFWRVVFPLLGPCTASLVVLNGLGIWNDFLMPYLALPSDQAKTITVAVYSFVGQYTARWDIVFAGTLISLVPALIIYISLQKYFVKGIMSGAAKG